MKLISKRFARWRATYRHVLTVAGYDGDNISPHLAWDDVPMGTKVLMTCYDPGRADRLRLGAALGGGEPPGGIRAY